MATSEQRELMAQIEELGYTYKGHDKNNAVVMYHPKAGAIRIHASASDHRSAMNLVREARRRIKQTEARYGKFVEWLMEQYEVGRAEQKELRLSLRDAAREYTDSHLDAGRMESLVAQVDQDERLEVLERKHGSKTWVIRLTGPDYGLENLMAETAAPDERAVNNDNPMEAVIDQLRHMMLAEMNGELEDLRAKNELTVDTLTHLLAALRDRPGVTT